MSPMRRALAIAAVLAAALAALPHAAHAQVPGGHGVVLGVDGWDAPARPLEGPVLTRMHADVRCPLPAAAPGATAEVSFHAPHAPPWATIVISPSSATASYADCADGVVRVEAQVAAMVDQAAPAFQPHEVVFEATAVDPWGESATAEATAVLQARYFSIVDVAAPKTIRSASPGERVEFPITFTNFGNGPTSIRFELDAPPGLKATAPANITLESKQTGGMETSKTVVLLVEAPEARGPVTLTLRHRAAYALDAHMPGDSGETSFIVQVEGWDAVSRAASSDDGTRLPVPASGAPLALVGAALALALATRRRHV